MQKEMSGIKSIFVPTNLLREELPIGYDQVAGADGEAETEGVDPDASVAPLFAPADAEHRFGQPHPGERTVERSAGHIDYLLIGLLRVGEPAE